MNEEKPSATNARIKRARPDIEPLDIDAVSSVLLSDSHGSGQAVADFENHLKSRIGAEYAKATNSATNALILALLGLEIGHGDEVILPSYVCYSVLSAVESSGAIPVLVDLDGDFGLRGYNISASSIAPKINSKTRAVIVPHMLGFPADMDEILSLGIPVIEDCAQSLGAHYKGKPVGSLGCISVFSFFATKVISTGHGGMVVTSQKNIAERIEDITLCDRRESHGRVISCPMTNIQAALGDSQLSRLESIVSKRLEIGARYDAALSKLKMEVPARVEGSFPFKYVLQLDNKAERKRMQGLFHEKNIGIDLPVFRPLHRYLDLPNRDFPNTENAQARTLGIPCYPSLKNEEIDRVIAAIAEFLKNKE